MDQSGLLLKQTPCLCLGYVMLRVDSTRMRISGYTEDYRDKCAVTLVRKQIFINSEHFYQTKLFSSNEEIDPWFLLIS